MGRPSIGPIAELEQNGALPEIFTHSLGSKNILEALMDRKKGFKYFYLYHNSRKPLSTLKNVILYQDYKTELY